LIPAILSCIFVAYLYQSLNKDSQKSNGSTKSINEANDLVQGLVHRLEGLQKRLNELAIDDKNGSGK
jgi:uncharacterized protein YoxC